MMFNAKFRTSSEEAESDEDTTSSPVSDTTSRTTGADSWYDVKSDTEQQQQLIKQLDKIRTNNMRELTDDDDDDDDEDDDDDNDDYISSINDVYNAGANTKKRIEIVTTTKNDLNDASIQDEQNQETQKAWVNPYWGDDWKPTTIVIKQTTDGDKLIETITTTGNDSDNVAAENERDQEAQKVWINPYWGDDWKPTTVVIKQTIDGDKLIETITTTGSDVSDAAAEDVQQHETQKVWINPYWGTDWKPTTVVIKQTTDGDQLVTTITTTENDVSDAAAEDGQDQETQKPWINPYWSTDSKPSSVVIKQTTDEDGKLTETITTTENDFTGVEDEDEQDQITQKVWTNPYWGVDWKPTSIVIEQTTDEDGKLTETITTTANDFTGVEDEDEQDSIKQKVWINPYWGADWKPTAIIIEQTTDGDKLIETITTFENDASDTAAEDGQEHETHKVWINPYWSTDSKPTTLVIKQTTDGDKLIETITTTEYDRIDAAAEDRGDDEKQNAWVNPYWGADWKPTTVVIKKITDEDDRLIETITTTEYDRSDATAENREKDEKQKVWTNPYWGDDWKPTTTVIKQTTDGEKLIESITTIEYDRSDAAAEDQGDHKKQNGWINPYWGDDWKPTTVVVKQTTDGDDKLIETITTTEYDRSDATAEDQGDHTKENGWINPYWGDGWKPTTVIVKQTTEGNKLIETITTTGNDVSDAAAKDGQEHETQKAWINPYWGADWTPTAVVIKQTTDEDGNLTGTITTTEYDVSDTTAEDEGDAEKQKVWINPYWGADWTPTTVVVKQTTDVDGNLTETITTTEYDLSDATAKDRGDNEKQNGWINPYWGDDWKPTTVVVKQTTDGDDKLIETITTTEYDRSDATAEDRGDNEKQNGWINPYWGCDWKPTTVVIKQTTDADGKLIETITATGNNLNDAAAEDGHDQAVQKVWINPYWGDDWKPTTIVIKQTTDGDKLIETITTTGNDFIDAAGEDGQQHEARKVWINPYWNADSKPATIGTREVIEDEKHDSESRGPSSSDDISLTKSTLNEPELSSEKVDHDVKPWANPYWSTSNQADDELTTEKITSLDSTTPSESKKKEDLIQRPESSSLLEENKSSSTPDLSKPSWKNPYWTVKTLERATSTTDIPPATTSSTESSNNPNWSRKTVEKATSTTDIPAAVTPTAESSKKTYWKDDESEIPKSAKEQDKTWENPYWKDDKSVGLTSLKEEEKSKDIRSQEDNNVEKITSVKEQEKCWENPYWKDNKPPELTSLKQEEKSKEVRSEKDDKVEPLTSTKEQEKCWENPYWNNNKPTAALSLQEEDRSKEIRSEKDSTVETLTSTKEQEKCWENPYWKDNKPPELTSLKEEEKSKEVRSEKDDKVEPLTSTKEQEKCWENPYWNNNKSTAALSLQEEDRSKEIRSQEDNNVEKITSAKEQEKCWENPYWKDNKAPELTSLKEEEKSKEVRSEKDDKVEPLTSTKEQEKCWENPYWNNNKSTAALSLQVEDKSKEIRSEKDSTVETLTSTKEQEKCWENPYWKDNKPLELTSLKEEEKSKEVRSEKDDKVEPLTSTKEQEKCWENPYWNNNKPTAALSLQEGDRSKEIRSEKDNNVEKVTSAKEQEKCWENPYWKDQKSQVEAVIKELTDNFSQKDNKVEDLKSAEEQEKPWNNPYWKEKTAPILTSVKEPEKLSNNVDQKEDKVDASKSIKAEEKSWNNPYWKDQKSDIPTPTQQQDRPLDSFINKDSKVDSLTSIKEQEKPLQHLSGKDLQFEPASPLKQQDQSWENPYWKDAKSQIISSATQLDKLLEKSNLIDDISKSTISIEPQNKLSQTLYDKDDRTQPLILSNKQDEPWINPYWKEQKSEASISTLTKEQNKYETQIPTTSKQQSIVENKQQAEPWQNPYWKDKNTSDAIPIPTSDISSEVPHDTILNNAYIYDNLSPPAHAVPPVPYFYERIYPIDTPPSSPRPTTMIEENNLPSFMQSMQAPLSSIPSAAYNYSTEDSDILPYKMDNQGTVHYNPGPALSPAITNKTVSFSTSSTNTQNPMSYLSTSGTAPSQTTNITESTIFKSDIASPIAFVNGATSPSITNRALVPSVNWTDSSSSSSNNYRSSLQSLATMVTPEELNDIQKVLHLLDISPNSIITIESSLLVATTNTSNGDISYPPSGFY